MLAPVARVPAVNGGAVGRATRVTVGSAVGATPVPSYAGTTGVSVGVACDWVTVAIGCDGSGVLVTRGPKPGDAPPGIKRHPTDGTGPRTTSWFPTSRSGAMASSGSAPPRRSTIPTRAKAGSAGVVPSCASSYSIAPRSNRCLRHCPVMRSGEAGRPKSSMSSGPDVSVSIGSPSEEPPVARR